MPAAPKNHWCSGFGASRLGPVHRKGKETLIGADGRLRLYASKMLGRAGSLQNAACIHCTYNDASNDASNAYIYVTQFSLSKAKSGIFLSCLETFQSYPLDARQLKCFDLCTYSTHAPPILRTAAVTNSVTLVD